MDNIDTFNKYVKRTVFIPASFMAVLLLGGCQSHTKANNTSAVPSASAVSKPLPTQQLSSPGQSQSEPAEDEGLVITCQRELLALSKINQQLYVQKKNVFDELLASASSYSSVRGDISVQTKDTLDALYKYKTQKICNDIEQSIRQALISRGENFK